MNALGDCIHGAPIAATQNHFTGLIERVGIRAPYILAEGESGGHVYIGKLKRGQPYSIEFSASSTNSGATFVGYFWHPISGPPTATTQAMVAPGATQQIGSGTVPDNAKILDINVRPPNSQGGGTLRVTQNDKVFDKPPVDSDTNWTFNVK